ncbi:hypothetical protein QAD02_003252 [Eretmocerus hayati]|uniref:Uncharacterized protein n=1 Tax=Eretmocerus hayati TaxID=131215 RepID=A0ACC2NLA6_9HYME|nr:hypothetical protein QAD02_003252 [Eretmocerus hayati]
MERADADTERVRVKVQLWLEGAPGGAWPPNLIIDNEDSDSNRCQKAWSSSSTTSSSREASTCSSLASMAEQGLALHSQGRPPQGRRPRVDLTQPTGQRSSALVHIKVQYASSDEDVEAPATKIVSLQAKERERKDTATTSAYSSGENEDAHFPPQENLQGRTRAAATTQDGRPVPPPRLKRRSRAERAARDASWSQALPERPVSDSLRAPIAEECAPKDTKCIQEPSDSRSEDKNFPLECKTVRGSGFVTPVFFQSVPAAMPVCPEEIMPLIVNLCQLQTRETEEKVLDYVLTQRALRQNRERVARHKRKKREQLAQETRNERRRQRVRTEREQELVDLAEQAGVSAHQAGSASQTSTLSKKRKPRRTLTAYKQRTAAATGAHLYAQYQASATSISNSNAADIREEVQTASDTAAAGSIIVGGRTAISSTRVPSPGKGTSNPVPIRALDLSTPSPVAAPADSSTTTVRVSTTTNIEYTCTTPAPSPHPSELVWRRPSAYVRGRSEIETASPQPCMADSTSGGVPGNFAATTTGSTDISQYDIMAASTRIVHAFNFLNAVSPLGGAPSAIPVGLETSGQGTASSRPDHGEVDDEFLAQLLQGEDGENDTFG